MATVIDQEAKGHIGKTNSWFFYSIYIDFKTLAKQNAWNSLQFYKKKVSIDLYYYHLSMTYHLKGSNWIFVQEAKIQLLENPREYRKIWQNYQRIMSL
jgi:hypothetical protein